MTQEQLQDGANQSQGVENLPPEDGLGDEDLDSRQEGTDDDWRQTVEARIDVLNQNMNNGLTQINQQLAALGQRSMTQEELSEAIDDDDEQLTPSRVKKIVNQAIGTAVSQSTEVNERKEWDTKARKEFPITDPKFEAEFNRQWRSFQDAGGDLRHPRAVYKVCSDTARVLGVSKSASRRVTSQEHDTNEPPNPARSSSSRRESPSSSAKISDDDPRMAMYLMKYGNNPEKVKKFKEKLAAKDAASKRKRRA